MLGLYSTIAAYYIMKGKAKSARALHDMPAPQKPDYHTGSLVDGRASWW